MIGGVQKESYIGPEEIQKKLLIPLGITIGGKKCHPSGRAAADGLSIFCTLIYYLETPVLTEW